MSVGVLWRLKSFMHGGTDTGATQSAPRIIYGPLPKIFMFDLADRVWPANAYLSIFLSRSSSVQWL